MHLVLWVLQALLALLFLYAGGIKLVTPPAQLTAATPFLSAMFLRFIGVMEILGGIGLVLPGLLRIRTELTSLAAAGLTIIMVGAVVVTLMTMEASMAIMPFVVGALTLFVAYGRRRLAPWAPRIKPTGESHA